MREVSRPASSGNGRPLFLIHGSHPRLPIDLPPESAPRIVRGPRAYVASPNLSSLEGPNQG